MRTINDWVVIRRLLHVPGVAEVANFGGFQKQFAVTFNQAQLARYGLALGDVEDAIKKNNAAGGGSVVSAAACRWWSAARAKSRTSTSSTMFSSSPSAARPSISRDIASVTVDTMVPNGIFSKDRQEPSVEGIVTMRKGENPSRVLARVQEAVEELNETELPARPDYGSSRTTTAPT